MKKIFLGLMLLASLTIQAQSTSRIMVGLGGGLTAGTSNGKFDNLCNPMGTLNLGYAVYGRPINQCMIGFRTGVNFNYSQLGMKARLDENFSRVDYYGHQLDYTVNGIVKYHQKQVNLEIPIMISIDAAGCVFNFGTKMIASLWNTYNQTISDPVVSAYYGDYGVTVVNDIATGIVSDQQCDISGKAKMPSLMFSISAELGYTWELDYSNRLGLDIFVDYVPFGIGASKDNQHQIVEINSIVNDCAHPTAPVSVYPLTQCNDFSYNYVNAGIKLIWAFDITHWR